MTADTTDAGSREKLRQYIALYKIYQNDDEFTDVILSLIHSREQALLARVETICENEKYRRPLNSIQDHHNIAVNNILAALATIKGEEISDE